MTKMVAVGVILGCQYRLGEKWAIWGMGGGQFSKSGKVGC